MFQIIRQQALTWLGIFGGALTLFSNSKDILELSGWARVLANKWGEFVMPPVSALIRLIGIHVSPSSTTMIAMAIFVSAIALGARVENEFKARGYENWPISWNNIFNRRTFLATLLYATQLTLVAAASLYPKLNAIYWQYPVYFILFTLTLYCSSIVLGLRGWPVWSALVIAITMVILSYIFSNARHEADQSNVSETASIVIAGIFAIGCGCMVLGLAPPVTFTKRLIFMLIGVLSIILLSELSKLGLSLDPPSNLTRT